MKNQTAQSARRTPDDLHDLSRQVHQQTGIFLRISTEEDLASLSRLVKNQCSPDILDTFRRLQSFSF